MGMNEIYTNSKDKDNYNDNQIKEKVHKENNSIDLKLEVLSLSIINRKKSLG